MATYTGEPAYNPFKLNAPPPPELPSTSFPINLTTTDRQGGLSIVHKSPFFGFSIEMSISAQVSNITSTSLIYADGKNRRVFSSDLFLVLTDATPSSHIKVPFLNLMSNIVERAGEVHIRCGGNTQEAAVMVEGNPNGAMIAKYYGESTGTACLTITPPIDYTIELIHTLGAISSLVPGVKWFLGGFLNIIKYRWPWLLTRWLGIPFTNVDFNMDIVQAGVDILGDNLIGLQAGNEPDFYVEFKRRQEPWHIIDYKGEVEQVIELLEDPRYEKVRNKIITPSVATEWPLQEVWDSNLVQDNRNSISYVSVERYPRNNCVAMFGNTGEAINPQDVIAEYLSHASVQALVGPYVPSALFAQSVDKPFIMFETNTASCGGFPGISNSFAGALWSLDYGLQMAYTNFSEALLHMGGQSVMYNPFTAPPTNVSSFYQWTVGPTYYSILIMAEVVGNSGKARVADLFVNNNNEFTPGYVIHEGGAPARLALFNYIEEASGTHDYTATVQVPGSISSVKVKRLSSDTVTQLSGYTWGGELTMETITCTPSTSDEGAATSTCLVSVPAPGFALVYLTEDAIAAADRLGSQPTATYSTSAVDKARNTATVPPEVLATSNGHDAKSDAAGVGGGGVTSKGSECCVGRWGSGWVVGEVDVDGGDSERWYHGWTGSFFGY
ncbi:hypothetical protein BDV98DRAFT_623195 [Pterulicium gracile]|uniref:Beta-glucuronidase C-terminal domain-containing protein n=1 Tax=Pterulicium gracile TaxID=1884261 RepID=A0A5C3QFK4_9AGAR|nr:hypothetical protein BDV98DRAFT_623195 [Pterula gracilis]